jgi:hypothetical protein
VLDNGKQSNRLEELIAKRKVGFGFQIQRKTFDPELHGSILWDWDLINGKFFPEKCVCQEIWIGTAPNVENSSGSE